MAVVEWVITGLAEACWKYIEYQLLRVPSDSMAHSEASFTPFVSSPVGRWQWVGGGNWREGGILVKGMVISGLRFQIPLTNDQITILHIPISTHPGDTSWPLIWGHGGLLLPEKQILLLWLPFRVGLLFIFPPVRCGCQRTLDFIVSATRRYSRNGFLQIGT